MKHYENINALKEHELAKVVGGASTGTGDEFVTIIHKNGKHKTFKAGSPSLQDHLDHGDPIAPDQVHD